MRLPDEYIAVRGRIKDVTGKAILFAIGTSVERGAWIPRSCIHGADDIRIDSARRTEEITLRIREWKVEECGLRSARTEDDANADLFDGRGLS